METAYDWITVMIFAALVTRFLQQSAKPIESEDSLWHYLVPSVGCAAANWLGNSGWHLPALALIAVTLWYAFHFLVRERGSPPDH